ncbi:MAG: energy-coupling factor ABC transporter ATP-binding protein [Spirochaetaceae bacterium]|jgi:biotin transport system ATP-binding protein|nr:energy-coupling factor ABC transporter ATP-binding protein [Spirochaetaceae bacterium]
MNEAAITLRNVSRRFRVIEYGDCSRVRDGAFYALNNISLDIKKGETAIIAGANGSGKSVLMSIIARLDDASSGSVEVHEKTGLVFQDADSQIIGESAREDVLIGLSAQRGYGGGAGKQRAAELVEEALRKAGLLEKADFPARFLSGGEKRRLAVAGVIAMNAGIIIFDEPYANLDYPGVIQINTLIEKLREEGKTIIILTHELEKCFGFANVFIVLYKGEVVFAGKPEAALELDLEAWGVRGPLSEKNGLIWK